MDFIAQGAGRSEDIAKHPSARLTAQLASTCQRMEAAVAQGIDLTQRPTAPDLLTKAANIMAERGKQYDKPEGERSMGKCVAAFNVITGQNLTEAEGWLLLQILKDVRQWQRPGYHADSAEDCIAYAALKAEAKQAEA